MPTHARIARLRTLLEARLAQCTHRTGGEGLFGPANQEAVYLRQDLDALADPARAGEVMAAYCRDPFVAAALDLTDNT